MTTLADIREQLKAPFALDDIDFLPKGKVERDGKTLCMALPYADPRVYQDRLNEVAYGEWSTPAPVVIAAGNKLICYVTVILCGVPHTDVGEATNNEENTGTEAWAQAFKRACSQFGLGRYLYDLEKEWVPFNPQRKMIDLDKAQKAAIVRKMYQKAGIGAGNEHTGFHNSGNRPIHSDFSAGNGVEFHGTNASTQSASVDRDEALRELARPGPARAGKNLQVQAQSASDKLAEVKAHFLKMYKPEKWEPFKVGVLGLPVADEGLSDSELARIDGKLTEIGKQKLNAAIRPI